MSKNASETHVKCNLEITFLFYFFLFIFLDYLFFECHYFQHLYVSNTNCYFEGASSWGELLSGHEDRLESWVLDKLWHIDICEQQWKTFW